MHLSNVLFISLLGVTSAGVLQQPKEHQCHAVTETSVGPGFWIPTPDAKVTPQAEITGGRFDDVLGQSKSVSSDKPSKDWSEAALDNSESGWGQWLSSFLGAGPKTSIASDESSSLSHDYPGPSKLTTTTSESPHSEQDGQPTPEGSIPIGDTGSTMTSLIGEHALTTHKNDDTAFTNPNTGISTNPHATSDYTTHGTSDYTSHGTSDYTTHSASDYTTHSTSDHTTHSTGDYTNSYSTGEITTHGTSDYTAHSTSDFTSPSPTTTILPDTSSTVLPDTPFVIVVEKKARKLSRRSLSYVQFDAEVDPSYATITNDASLAFLAKRDDAGQIRAWMNGSKTITPESDSSLTRLKLCSNCGPRNAALALNGNSLSFPGASFCMKPDGFVYMNFGQVAADCDPINLSVATECATCPAPLGGSSTTGTGSTSPTGTVSGSGSTSSSTDSSSGTTEISTTIMLESGPVTSTSSFSTGPEAPTEAGPNTSSGNLSTAKPTETGITETVGSSTEPTIPSDSSTTPETSTAIGSVGSTSASTVDHTNSGDTTAIQTGTSSKTDIGITSDTSKSIPSSETTSTADNTLNTGTSSTTKAEFTTDGSSISKDTSAGDTTTSTAAPITSESTTVPSAVDENHTSIVITTSTSEDPKETSQSTTSTTPEEVTSGITTGSSSSITAVSTSTTSTSESTSAEGDTTKSSDADVTITTSSSGPPTTTTTGDEETGTSTTTTSEENPLTTTKSADITTTTSPAVGPETTISSGDKVDTTSIKDTETTMTSAEEPQITTSTEGSIITTSTTGEPETTKSPLEEPITTTTTSDEPVITGSSTVKGEITTTTSSDDPLTTTTTSPEVPDTTIAPSTDDITTSATSADDQITTTAPTTDDKVTSTADSETNSSSTEEVTTTTSSDEELITSTPFSTLNATGTGIFSNSSTNSSTSTTPYAPEQTFELEGPIDLGSVSPTVLDPVSPPDIDMGSLDRFDPVEKSNLWFNGANAGGDEENGAVTVRIAIDYQYPSIVLDQSIYITDITCDAGSIKGRINNADAYAKAKESWVGHPLIFITTTPSCVAAGDSSFFFLSSDVAYVDGTMTFSILGSITTLADVSSNMDIDFGQIDYTVPDVQNDPTDTASNNTCGSPDQSELLGLPAVACGTNFDQALNDRLGYYSSSGDQQYVLDQAASGPATGGQTKRSYVTDLAVRSNLQKRGFFSFIKKAVAVVQKVVAVVAPVIKKVVAVVAPVIQKVVQVVAPVIKAVVKTSLAVVNTVAKIAVFVATGNYDGKLTLPLTMGPPSSSLTDSPWGKAIKFYSWTPEKGGELWNAESHYLEKIQSKLIGEPEPEPGVEFFCINCGIKGQIIATGSISATPLSGIKKAQIGAKGNLYAGLYLGVNAFAKYEKKYEKQLYSRGLPGWSIPGIVTLGPMMTLGVEAGISIEAEGQLLAGASLNWPNFDVTLDFVDFTKSSQSGLVPQVDRKFEVAGTISAETSLGLPVAIEFGVDILKGKFKRSVALTNTPAVVASAELAASYNVDTGATLGSEECPGISWDIKVRDEITLGFKKGEEEGPQFKLKEWTSGALAEGCVKLGAGGGSGENTGSTSGGNDGSSSSSVTTTSSVPSTTSTKTTSAGSTGISTSSSTTTSNSPSVPSAETNPAKCGYWKGKQWKDSRGNAWDVSCDRSSYDFPELFIGNVYYAESMLSCFETCTFDNGRCERSFWKESAKQCYVVNVLVDSKGFQRTTNGNAPWDYSETFDAVAFPVSPFTIQSIIFDMFAVEDTVRPWWNRGHWLEVNTKDFWQAFGDSDPGVRKDAHMLFKYGSEMRIMSFLEYDIWYVQPGPIQNPPEVERLVADPIPAQQAALSRSDSYDAASRIRVWEVGWSGFNIPASSVPNCLSTIYYRIQNLNVWIPNPDAFDGIDYRPGDRKTAIWWIEYVNDAPGVITPAIVRQPDLVNYYTWHKYNKMMVRDLDSTDIPYNLLEARQDDDDSNGAEPAPAETVDSSEDDSDETPVAPAETLDSSGPKPYQMIVSDSSIGIFLNPGKDGNLWLSTTETSDDDVSKFSTHASFIGTDGDNKMVIGDTSENYLHYFPDELSKTGASRLRLASWDKLPIGSKLLSLVEVTSGSDSMLVGVDAEGNSGYLWFCAIEGQLNKVFLTTDALEAEGSLENEDMKFVVTGGKASDCGPIALRVTLGEAITAE